MEIFDIFGFPRRLHSDQGKEFINKTLVELCKLAMIEKTKTTAYHPAGNGTVERLHQFFKNAAASFVRDDHRNWDEIFRFLIPAYNNARHAATRFF